MTILDSITGLSESHWCLRNGKQIADSFGFNKCILLRLVEMQIYYLFTHSTKLWVPYRDSSVQSLSYPTLCHPMNHSTSGLPVHHKLPEFTQTHLHRVNDAIQASHPLSSPSPPALNPSQHQGLFQWVNSSYEVTKVLEFQLQQQSFQRTPRTDLL